MRSILLSLIARAMAGLNRLSLALDPQQSEWFTNRSGHSSFRPEIIPQGSGFNAVISRRTGYSSRDWRYQPHASAGQFSSARKALRAGRRMARQMAELRYRFD